MYPVPAATHTEPCQVKCPMRNLGTLAASGATLSSRARALGPCTAITARSAVVSVPPSASRTLAVFDALGMTSNASSRTHHTMMSSSTDASASSSRWVY